ncbi:MAG: hypothetical protein O2960_30825 [Verrucomicrobia bacterium]|nr:hypothetical protein [Verrucomicrobiota bacterium]
MRQMVNGQVVDVPTGSDGALNSDTLRKAAGIPDDRPLVLQMPDGNNHLVNPGERLKINPGQYFMDAPLHTRGFVV